MPGGEQQDRQAGEQVRSPRGRHGQHGRHGPVRGRRCDIHRATERHSAWGRANRHRQVSLVSSFMQNHVFHSIIVLALTKMWICI